MVVKPEKRYAAGFTRRISFFGITFSDLLMITKAVMETSKPVASLAANPGMVRAGADQQAENPSGAASRNPLGE